MRSLFKTMHSLRKHALEKLKLTPSYLISFIFQQNSLRRFRPRFSHSFCRREDDSDEAKEKKQEENMLYLYKSRGQHLLNNTRILDAIVRKSNIKPTDTVLEIGPGTGNLTLKLLEAAEKVVAIEIDKRMVEVLNKRVTEHGLQDRLTVIQRDAVKTEFPRFDLVVANIPYNISSPLVAKLVYGSNPFRSATLLLQKEFSRRLLANPGDPDFNRLAVNVKVVADVEFVMDVSKRDFVPSPKVDSSVVIIRPKTEIPDVNFHEWLAFTRMCFGKKNKTLGATFKQKKKVVELLRLSEMTGLNDQNTDKAQAPGLDEDVDDDDDDGAFSSSCNLDTDTSMFKERIIRVLKSSGFEGKRPSKLSHEELLHLLSLFNQAGIFFHNHSKPMDIDD